MGVQSLNSLQSFQQEKHITVSADSSFAVCSRQPILADEVQTFKALITVHKVLQEGHPITVREGQVNVGWLESLTRGVAGDGIRGGLEIITAESANLCRWVCRLCNE